MAGSLRLVKAPDVYELRVYVGCDSSGWEASLRLLHREQAFRTARPRRTRTQVEQAKENKADLENIWASSTTLNAAFDPGS